MFALLSNFFFHPKIFSSYNIETANEDILASTKIWKYSAHGETIGLQ